MIDLMEMLEEESARRRKEDPDFARIEAEIEAEGGGYEVHVMTDGSGKRLPEPILIAAGDENGPYEIAEAARV